MCTKRVFLGPNMPKSPYFPIFVICLHYKLSRLKAVCIGGYLKTNFRECVSARLRHPEGILRYNCIRTFHHYAFILPLCGLTWRI